MIRFENIRDKGVSPVVGVMLILVIMIVLVGVFALVATSLLSPGEKPINAEITYFSSTSDNQYVFEMTAGDSFQRGKLKLVFKSRENGADFAERFNITATHDKSVMLGDRLSAPIPDAATEFDPAGKHIIWMFYDIGTGTLVSSGEIPPS